MRQVTGLAVLTTLIAAPFFVNAEESLRSSAEYQPLVLAQAGSTGGTIGKENRSVSGGVENAPLGSDGNPPRSRSSVARTPKGSRSGDSCGRVVGSWTWSNGIGVVVKSGGTAEAIDGGRATLNCGSGTYLFTWSAGNLSRMTLSSDGRRMSGTGILGAESAVRN